MEEATILIEVEEGGLIAQAMELLTKAVAEFLNNEAMEFPVHVVHLGCNGSHIVARYVSPSDAALLSEHYDGEQGVFLFPIHTFIMDRHGHTARIITAEKDTVRPN